VLSRFYEGAVRMNETVALEAPRYLSVVPDEVSEGLSDTNARSLLIWRDYCLECASQACYGDCSFYALRKDVLCRHFESADIVAIEVESWQYLQNQHLQMPIARVS
jgi:hypothetical protein